MKQSPASTELYLLRSKSRRLPLTCVLVSPQAHACGRSSGRNWEEGEWGREMCLNASLHRRLHHTTAIIPRGGWVYSHNLPATGCASPLPLSPQSHGRRRRCDQAGKCRHLASPRSATFAHRCTPTTIRAVWAYSRANLPLSKSNRIHVERCAQLDIVHTCRN